MQMLNFPSPYQPGESPYSIFKDRMTAITSIVQGIKGRILNKYNKGLINGYIEQLNKALSKDQQTEAINLLNATPTDIYPDEEKLNTMAGQFVDYANIVGSKLYQKETMMGNLPTPMARTGVPSGVIPTGTLPGVAPSPAPTSEVMLPKGDSMQLLNAIMNMPEGKMDFAPILNYMKENRPGMMGSFSPEEQWVLNQAMGQISDPKEELGEGLDLAKQFKEYEALFEKPTEKAITSKYEMFLKHPEQFELMTRIEASYKGEERTAWEVKVDQLLEWREKNMISDAELKKGIGIDVTPEKQTQWDKEYDLLMKTDPSDNEIKKFVNAWITPKEPDDPDKLKPPTSTDVNTRQKLFYEGDDGWGAITPEDYEEACNTWDAMKKNLPKPKHLDILEEALKYCLDFENKMITRGGDNKATKEFSEAYEWIYPYYKDALKGASPKYLPPEEIKKVGGWEGAFTGKGVSKGDYSGSALVTDQEGKEKDDKGYIVGETYRDEEGKLWKYLGDGKFEEVEEEKKTKKRTR